MKIKNAITFGMMFFVVVSIASAGVLDIFGKINAIADVSVNSNILLWLPLDEDSGCFAYDLSQYNNDGSLKPDCPTNSPIWGSLIFDGIDDYVEVPSSLSLDITDAITMEVWVKLNPGGSDTWYDIVRRSTGYEISVSRDTGIIEVALNDGSWHWYDSLSSINLDGSTWYHIAVTWEKTNGKVKIYINGNLDRELNGITTTLQPSGSLWIGGASTAWSTYGNIDNPRIWKIVLTPEQIHSIYQEGVDG